MADYKIDYVHPKEYKGLKLNTPNVQNVRKLIVEKYCLRCDSFMGKEHDFSECPVCPFPNKAVPLINPEQFVKCKSE